MELDMDGTAVREEQTPTMTQKLSEER